MQDRDRSRLGAIAVDRAFAIQLVEMLVDRDLADPERSGRLVEGRRDAVLAHGSLGSSAGHESASP